MFDESLVGSLDAGAVLEVKEPKKSSEPVTVLTGIAAKGSTVLLFVGFVLGTFDSEGKMVSDAANGSKERTVVGLEDFVSEGNPEFTAANKSAFEGNVAGKAF